MTARPFVLPLLALTVSSLPAAQFQDVASEVGASVLSSSMWGSGVGILDYDGDGLLDIYVVDGFGDPNVFFHNQGNRTFTETAASLGLGDTGWGKAVAPADIDNDGDTDLLLTNYDPAQSNKLYRNDGNVFTDISNGSGFDFADKCTGAAWADYDNDGFLDAYITVYDGSHKNRLMRNFGGGVFVDVADLLSVANETGWGYQAVWLDYDNDGDQDIYIANDDFFGGTANVLFRNNGDGSFTDVSVASGADVSIASMGLAIGDYNNDGNLDIYITNISQGNVLLRNEGDGTFTDVSEEQGVEAFLLSWGANFFDYDHDGLLDLYVDVSSGGIHEGVPAPESGSYPNRLFHNLGTGFEDVSAASGASNAGQTFGSAVVDYDGDGDLDIYITNFFDAPEDSASALYENNHIPREASAEDWLRVRLIGTASNRDGVGARVWIWAGGETQMRERAAGGSYLSCDEPILHFGLGEETSVSDLYVRWPSGLLESYAGIPGGQTITLVEGDGVPASVGDAAGGSAGVMRVGPNPFRYETDIFVAAAGRPGGALVIHDAQGRSVRSFPQGRVPGISVRWDGRDDRGVELPAGVYYARLSGGSAVHKILRLK
jgi:hypothetical protein